MKNKILVLLLLIAIVFQIPPSISCAAEEDELYNEAVSFLEQIFENVLFEDSDHVITRGELVSKLYSMRFTDSVWSGESYFEDITTKDVYFNAVNGAASLGWVAKADKFNPGSGMNGIDALKVMICAFDYKIVADALGGYPDGYLNFASKSKILSGFSFKQNGYITAREFTIMLYNLLLADAYDISITSASGVSDSIDLSKSDMTNLEKLFKIKSLTGVITKTQYTSLVLDELITETPSISINGYKYESKIPYGEKYLGLNADVFYRTENGVEKIVAITPYDNKETVLGLSEYDEVTSEYISYEKDSKIKKYKLSGDVKWVYNGRRVNTYKEAFTDSSVGQFRLIDNDGDEKYDVIIIDEYEYYTVESVDAASKTIGIYDNPKIEIRESDYFKCMDKEANPIDLIKVSANSAIAVKMSEDGFVKMVVLLDEELNGKITEISGEDREITIDGKTYKYSKQFEKKELSSIMLGAEIVVFLGLEGDVALKAMVITDYQYGYLISMPAPERKEDVTLEVFTPHNKAKTYYLADKVIINGEKPIEKTLVSLGYGLIKYRLDNDGKVKAIDTYQNANDVTSITDDNSLLRYVADESCYYRSGPKAFVDLANISNAVIFVVPTTHSEDEEDYGIIYINELVSSKKYTVDVYDIDKYGYAKVVIIKGEPDIKQNFKSYLIEKVAKCVNKNGDETYFIDAWSGGVKNKYVLNPDVSVTNSNGKMLEFGDVVRMRIVDGEVVQIIPDIIMGSGVAVLDGKTNLTLNAAPATSYYAAGYAYSASGNVLNIVDTPTIVGDIYPVAETTNLVSMDTGTYFYKINRKHKIIILSSVNDIHTSMGYGLNPHYVVARMTSDMSDEIYIFE